MIIFKNPQNIEIFKSFIDEFDKVINENFNAKTITICAINNTNKYFNFIASQTDPFATNLIITPFIVAVNEDVCLQLNLTQKEQHAMIAHEIGHILFHLWHAITNGHF